MNTCYICKHPFEGYIVTYRYGECSHNFKCCQTCSLHEEFEEHRREHKQDYHTSVELI